MVLYNYPPSLVPVGGGVDQIDGMELIEADVSFYSSDGKQLKTTLKASNLYEGLLSRLVTSLDRDTGWAVCVSF